MKRLFVAVTVTPGEHLLNTLWEMKRYLRYEKIKWVEPGNMHITLKFVGEITDNRIPSIVKTLHRVAERHTAFSFHLKNTGIFGSRYNPRVIWFDIPDGESLTALGTDVLNSLDEAGFPKDRQNFVPHLTIGRIKALQNKKAFQKVIDRFKESDIQPVNVPKITLYQSILKPSGPVYIPLENFMLKKS